MTTFSQSYSMLWNGLRPCSLKKLRRYSAGLALLALALNACSVKKSYDAPDVTASRHRDVTPPPGMVYVPSGSINYKTSMDNEATLKKVSLSPFFIDATEVTNKQFRAFVNWVADSIAVTDYLKDDSYFISGKKKEQLAGLKRRIDWSKVRAKSPLWQSSDPEIQAKLGDLVIDEGGRRILNKDLVKYQMGYMKAGKDNTRKFVTEAVGVLPDYSVWVTDFPNSQMSFMATNYYNHRAYDNHPVVGVTWKQARAYAYWRSNVASPLTARYKSLKSYQLTFTLPTEAQWQYAAAGMRDADEKVGNALMTYRDRRGNTDKLSVNFKQEEGDYVEDGSIFTLPVKSYMPNKFGVFNMAGNVSEWTLDAYSPSASEFVHDLNPVLLYDAADNEPIAMKRKVIRGGSWKDNAELLDVETRGYEIQDMSHSYIGFRCVMPAPEPLSDQVKTRKKLQAQPSAKPEKKSRSKAEEKLSSNK